MAHPRQAVKHNIVFVGDFAQALEHLFAFLAGEIKALVKSIYRGGGCLKQLRHLGVVVAPFLDFGQAVAHFFNQRGGAVLVRQQVVNQIGIAHHRPNIAQHLKQHACRAAGAALAAQVLQGIPRRAAQQADDDFTVGIRGVVVGDFADALGGFDAHKAGSVCACALLLSIEESTNH